MTNIQNARRAMVRASAFAQVIIDRAEAGEESVDPEALRLAVATAAFVEQMSPTLAVSKVRTTKRRSWAA